MRILQLIDSLDVGGAERIAVNYANALSSRIAFSGLVATRKEGALRSRINENVFFSCLHKRFTFDLGSILRLRSLCIANNVEWIHAKYLTAECVPFCTIKLEIDPKQLNTKCGFICKCNAFCSYSANSF